MPAKPQHGKAPGEKTVNLTPRIAKGDIQQVKVLFELDGQLKLKMTGADPIPMPVQVKAQLVYDEKVLEGPTSNVPWPQATARHYQTAQATIQFREGSLTPRLRPDRRIVGFSGMSADDVAIYSPLGPLNRDELDLLDVPANSAVIDGLLPRRPVAVGETWKLESSALPVILGIDAVSEHTVECTLHRWEDGLALVHVQGTVKGSTGGVSTDMSVAAKLNFDVARKRISWFAMSLKEDRSIGHAQPGLTATLRVQMSASHRAHVPHLHDNILADLDFQADDATRFIEFSSTEGGFDLLLGRNWHVMVDRGDVSIMRLVDRGELVAQCNISSLPPVSAGEPFTIVDFQDDVKRALDSSFGELAAANESLTDSGLHVMRVAVSGVVSDVPIQWVYYHIADDQGRRASCVFTHEADVTDRFGAEDQMLVNSFRFRDRQAAAVASQVPAAAR